MKRLAILGLAILGLTACGPYSKTSEIVVNPDGTCYMNVYEKIPAKNDKFSSYYVPCPEGVSPRP